MKKKTIIRWINIKYKSQIDYRAKRHELQVSKPKAIKKRFTPEYKIKSDLIDDK